MVVTSYPIHGPGVTPPRGFGLASWYTELPSSVHSRLHYYSRGNPGGVRIMGRLPLLRLLAESKHPEPGERAFGRDSHEHDVRITGSAAGTHRGVIGTL